MMLWPGNPNSSARAHLLCRSLESQKLLHRRTLPDDIGIAVLLTKQGADMASDLLGISVFCWEKMGTISVASTGKPPLWYPCKRLKHALFTRTAIAYLYTKGVKDFKSEEDWKTQPQISAGKIPDSTFVYGENNFWVEVENAHKTGKNMEEVAIAAVDVLLGRKKEWKKFCLVAAKGTRHKDVFEKHFKVAWRESFATKILFVELDVSSDPRVKVLKARLEHLNFEGVVLSSEEIEWNKMQFEEVPEGSNIWELRNKLMDSYVILQNVSEIWEVSIYLNKYGTTQKEPLPGIKKSQVELAKRHAKKWAYPLLRGDLVRAISKSNQLAIKALGL